MIQKDRISQLVLKYSTVTQNSMVWNKSVCRDGEGGGGGSGKSQREREEGIQSRWGEPRAEETADIG